MAMPEAIDDAAGEVAAILTVESHVDELGTEAERRRRRLLRLLGVVDALLVALLLGGARLLEAGHVQRFARKEHHRRDLLGLLVGDVLDGAEILLDEDAAGRLDGAGEERLQAVEVVLGPVLDERMVMALGTADVDAEEARADVDGDAVEVLDPRLEEVAGPGLLRVAVVGEHHLAEHPVPRLVLREAGREILAEAVRLFPGARIEERGELVRLMAGEGGRGEKAVDELGLLGRIRVGEIRVELGGGRHSARQIEHQPAQQRRVVGERGRLRFFLGELRIDVMVDRGLDRPIGGERVGAHGDRGESASGGSEKIPEHRGFASARGGRSRRGFADKRNVPDSAGEGNDFFCRMGLS